MCRTLILYGFPLLPRTIVLVIPRKGKPGQPDTLHAWIFLIAGQWRMLCGIRINRANSYSSAVSPQFLGNICVHRQLQSHAPNRLSMLKKYGNSWRAPGETGVYWNGEADKAGTRTGFPAFLPTQACGFLTALPASSPALRGCRTGSSGVRSQAG